MDAEVEQPTGFTSMIRLFVEAIENQSQQAEADRIAWDRFGSLAAYAISVYGLSTMLVALLLNRTSLLASSNTRRNAPDGLNRFFRKGEWTLRVVLGLLRLLAVALLLLQAYHVLVGLWVVGKTRGPDEVSRLTRMIPAFFEYDPEVFNRHRYLRLPADEVRFGPTSDMLWPVFLSVSYLLFVETFASAIRGTKPHLEGGISLFELSLSLQEMSSGFFFLRPHLLAKRPSEQVLVVCLFLLADHISNQVGAVLYAGKYRLIPLACISVCFVWYYVSCVFSGDAFGFPVNINFTYTGLVFVLAITLVCFTIFALAVLAKGPRMRELSYASYFAECDEESDFFSKHLGVSLEQDFYTAAINVGMFAITLAGRSSYIVAYNVISTPQLSWMEMDLFKELHNTFDVSNITSNSDAVQSGKVLAYLKENYITGYGNIVNNPSTRMITGERGERVPTHSSVVVKAIYIKEIGLRFGEYVFCMVGRTLLGDWLPRAFKKYIMRRNVPRHEGEETEQEFEARRNRAPRFVQRMLKRKASPAAEVQAMPEEEEDDSPDYWDDDVSESELESDAESIDLTTGHVLPGRLPIGASETPLNELMTSETFIELIAEQDVLQHHLNYDLAASGMMTRSRYNALHKPRQDEPRALLDLILSIRKERLEPAPVDDDNLDPRMACVICQVKQREIITWPCKCFSICESCRLSLVGSGMEGCVCCRREVEGVSRVFLP